MAVNLHVSQRILLSSSDTPAHRRVKQYHSRTPQYDQILKKNEQMYALLATTLSLCPAAQKNLEETINSQLREKYATPHTSSSSCSWLWWLDIAACIAMQAQIRAQGHVTLAAPMQGSCNCDRDILKARCECCKFVHDCPPEQCQLIMSVGYWALHSIAGQSQRVHNLMHVLGLSGMARRLPRWCGEALTVLLRSCSRMPAPNSSQLHLPPWTRPLPTPTRSCSGCQTGPLCTGQQQWLLPAHAMHRRLM